MYSVNNFHETQEKETKTLRIDFFFFLQRQFSASYAVVCNPICSLCLDKPENELGFDSRFAGFAKSALLLIQNVSLFLIDSNLPPNSSYPASAEQIWKTLCDIRYNPDINTDSWINVRQSGCIREALGTRFCCLRSVVGCF